MCLHLYGRVLPLGGLDFESDVEYKLLDILLNLAHTFCKLYVPLSRGRGGSAALWVEFM